MDWYNNFPFQKARSSRILSVRVGNKSVMKLNNAAAANLGNFQDVHRVNDIYSGVLSGQRKILDGGSIL